MKKILLTAVLLLIGAMAFAQERIAVFPFEDMENVFTRNESVLFYREFSNEFANRSAGRFAVIPRQEVEKLINIEAAFQLSDFSAARTKTAEMQRVLNGSQILSGLIGKVGNNIRITVSLYTYPELQQLPGGATLSVSNKNELFSKIPELVQSMQNAIAGSGGRTAITPTPANRTYNIGDTGPAGGIVFYDKGVFSGGWRYLEAAPVETEFTAQWGTFQQDIANTSTVVGSGRRNTDLILERLRQLDETGRAAQVCTGLNFDGFSDWFLPSKDELNLMYQNLKQKGLGGFGNSWYWSSLQGNGSTAWQQNFGSGQQSNANKYYNYSVRAIRAF
jgi:TolB-like protein